MIWRRVSWTKLQSAGFAFFAAVVVCGVGLLFVPILKDRRALQLELFRLDRELARQEALEKRQLKEIEALKNDPAFLERTARDKLNLAKPDETLFRFIPEPGSRKTDRRSSLPTNRQR